MKNKTARAVLAAFLIAASIPGIAAEKEKPAKKKQAKTESGSVKIGDFDPLNGKVHRYNIYRSGVWPSSGISGTPSLKWEFKTEGPVRSSPVVIDSSVFVGSHDGNFYSLDAEKGVLKWKFKTEGAVSGSAAIFEDKVIFASEDGRLYCLKKDSGEKIWSTVISSGGKGTGTAGSPAIAHGLAFIGGGAEGATTKLGMSAKPIVGVEISTGKLLWQGDGAGPQGFAAIATDGKTIYAGANGSAYGAWDIESSQSIGTVTGGHQARQFMSMTLASEFVYIPVTLRGAVMCMKKEPFNLRGRVWYTSMLDGNLDVELNAGGSFGHECFTDLAVTEKTVFAGSQDGLLYTFDAKTGKKGWIFKTGGEVMGSPAVASKSNIVIFGSCDGKLYALDADSGTKKWDFTVGDKIIGSSWIEDGAIFFGCDDGKIRALK